MDRPSYPIEAFPLKGGEALPSQPPGPAMVPYTTVNMSTERPPKDYIGWSLLSFWLCSPCCLGTFAVIFSNMARNSNKVGDFHSARHYGNTACSINIAAIILYFILVGVIIYLYFTQPYWAVVIISTVSRKWI